VHRAGEHRRELHLARQPADEVDAAHLAQLRDLLEAELELAARDQLADQHPRGRLPCLRLQLLRDAQALEQLGKVYPARPARVHDRFRRAQRALQRLDAADVGLARAGAHCRGDLGFREIDAGARSRGCRRDQVLDQAGGADRPRR
jgi:hypothetical protein